METIEILPSDYKRIYCTTGIASKTGVPFIKIGDTKYVDVGDRDTYVREENVYDWEAVKSCGTRYRDYDLHPFIDKNFNDILFRTEFKSKGREQYDIIKCSSLYESFINEGHLWGENTKSILIDLLRKIQISFETGIQNKKYDFGARNEQLDCVNKIVRYFTICNGKGKFLIAAKMRFGKTFTTYNACLALNAKKVLIITYKPAAKSSWESDLNNHVNFDNCMFFDYKENVHPTFDDSSKMNVFFVSFQSLLSNDRMESEKFDWIYSTEWDVVVLDEIHYGTDTSKAKEILSRLNVQKELHLSGTPFKQMLLGEFDRENTFNWTYVDEQEAKRAERSSLFDDFDVKKTMYQSLPMMKFFSIELDWNDSELAKINRKYNDEEYPTLAKVFAVENNEFINLGGVRAILSILMKKFPESNYVKDSSSLDHIFMLVPGVDAGRTLCKELKNNSLFKTYEIIDACGSGEDVDVDIVDVKSKIKRCDRTITVSCGRFTEAVTVEQWGTVVMLSDMASPSTYMQTIFRCQSPNTKLRDGNYKKECYVVDFDLNRTLSAIYQYVAHTCCDSEYVEKTFRRFLLNAPIYNSVVSSVEFNEMQDFNEIFRIAQDVTTSGKVNRFNGNTVLLPNVFDESCFGIVKGIDCDKTLVSKLESIITSNKNLKKGKTFNVEKSKIRDKELNINNTSIQKLLMACRVIEMRLPRYLEISEMIERCLSDLFIVGDEETEEIFQDVVGITRSEFKTLVDAGFFDHGALDDKIGYFAILDDELSF
jgi:type II restriction enzyme